MSAIIYLLTNTVNGKQYVGQTRSKLHERWSGHCKSARRGSTAYLHNAIRKYGPEVFTHTVLEETTPEEVNDREMYWIATLNTKESGYNMTDGGESGWSYVNEYLKTHDDVESARRKKLKNRIFTEEHRARLSISNRNRTYDMSPEACARRSESQRNKKMPKSFTEKNRQRMLTNNPFKGKKHSEETREKMRERWRRWRETKEAKETKG